MSVQFKFNDHQQWLPYSNSCCLGMAPPEHSAHCSAPGRRLDSRMDVLNHWHIILANFFAEGGAYNIGCDRNVTLDGRVLNITFRSASDPAFDGNRTFEAHQMPYDRELTMPFRYCDSQRNYSETHHFGDHVTATWSYFYFESLTIHDRNYRVNTFGFVSTFHTPGTTSLNPSSSLRVPMFHSTI
jgi:hypothetical protein